MRKLLSGLVLPLVGLGLGLATASAETKLSYASHVPSTHILHTEGLKPFFEQVTKDTNGSIVFEEFSGGSMGGGKSLLPIVRDGVVDSALIVYLYYKKDLPISDLITALGLLGGNNMAMAGASAETHLLDCPACLEEHKKNNFKALAYYASAPYTLMCAKEVRSVDDLQGLKVRAVGPWALWLKSVGAVPVSVPSSEVYEAMQRGQADCTIGSSAWLRGYNLKDVVTHIVDMDVGVYHGALAFPLNASTWDQLSVDERKAIVKNLPGITRRMVMAYRNDNHDARQEAIEAGVNLIEPSDDLRDSYQNQRLGEVARVTELGNDAGIENAEVSLSAFFDNVEKWNRIVAEIEEDPDKFEQALWDEIYSKIDVTQ